MEVISERFIKPVLVTLFTAAFITEALSQDNELTSEAMTSLFSALVDVERSAAMGPYDDITAQPVYDFIVVGAGAAGCVVANRLTEVEDWTVLLLEAGSEETSIIDTPYLAGQFLGASSVWPYKTVPSKSNLRALVDQKIDYPLAKVLGGGTSLNYMTATRGNSRDFDNWEKMGNPGWDYDSVLPYFKKSENVLIPELRDSKFRSTTGNIGISFPSYQSPLSSILLEAASDMGYEVGDFNGENQVKLFRNQLTMKNSTRFSSFRGYVDPIRNRENLSIMMRSTVHKIITDSETKIVSGVQYERNGINYTALANYEVIICAGTVKSAQLLMLSGIGPEEHLRGFNIPVLADLPVGNNFRDHAAFYGLLFTTNQSTALTPRQILTNMSNYAEYFVHKHGPLTTAGPYETMGFLELKNTSYFTPGWPNIEVIFSSSSPIVDRENARNFRIREDVYEEFLKPLTNEHNFQIVVFPVRPKSKGTVRLRTLDINSEPEIDPQFFSSEEDVDVVVEGIKEMIKFTRSSRLQQLGVKIHGIPLPPCSNFTFGSDSYWRCAVKQFSFSLYHPTGTCKMGPSSDPSSVVSPELKVHGIERLRVIDASVMPMITSGHLMLPTYMIAEKGSDMIKESHKKLP